MHTIFVKTLSGRTLAFECIATDHIGHLLREINGKEPTAVPGSYYLIFAGARLLADRTLKDYNIPDQATIHIARRCGYQSPDYSLEKESWDRWLVNSDAEAEANERIESHADKKSRTEVGTNSRSEVLVLVETNRANIAKNRADLFLAECEVMQNKASAYLARSLVQENQALIAKNYHSAFMGNRQLANQNTEDLFRNRYLIYRNMAVDASSAVQVNYREALTNRAKVEFLEHRSALNTKVLGITLKMTHINAQLIDINSEIMESNRGIVDFNAASIAKNSEILNSGILSAAGATPESNAIMIAETAKRIANIRSLADRNHAIVHSIQFDNESSRIKVLANTEMIYDRRASIMANAAKIKANQQAIALFVGNI